MDCLYLLNILMVWLWVLNLNVRWMFLVGVILVVIINMMNNLNFLLFLRFSSRRVYWLLVDVAIQRLSDIRICCRLRLL